MTLLLKREIVSGKTKSSSILKSGEKMKDKSTTASNRNFIRVTDERGKVTRKGTIEIGSEEQTQNNIGRNKKIRHPPDDGLVAVDGISRNSCRLAGWPFV